MSLISRFTTGEYKVIRTTKGKYVRGHYVPGPKEELCISGSLQPTTARELKLPEEGNRLKQFWKLYTDEPILTNNTATLASPDEVTIDGEIYRAMSLLAWRNVDLPYFVTVLWREPQQPSDGKGAGA